MDRDLHAHLLMVAAAALIAAQAGCAVPLRTAQPTITDDTRARLVRALQDSGDTANAAIVRSQTAHQAGQPVDPLTHATALVTAGQVDEGIAVAKASLASRGDDIPHACEVGRLAVKSGRLKDAGEVYGLILQRHPDSPEALNGMGVVLAQLGDLNGAADTFRKALAQRPQDGPATHNLELVTTLIGKAESAAPAPDGPKPSAKVSPVKATLTP
jgi:Flp pilus assembly protein TadD